VVGTMICVFMMGVPSTAMGIERVASFDAKLGMLLLFACKVFSASSLNRRYT